MGACGRDTRAEGGAGRWKGEDRFSGQNIF